MRNLKAVFRLAAAFNLLGAATLAFMPATLQVTLNMPVGASSLYGQCVIAFILTFAWMYWRVAGDPKTYRPYIEAGTVGKLATVSIVLFHWATGGIGPALPLMVMGDLAFAVAFIRYLASDKGAINKNQSPQWATQPK